MAAIDKIYLTDYYTFTDFRVWCMTYKPSLLRSFYNPFLSEKEWNEWKETVYIETKERVQRHHEWCDTVEHLKARYIELYGKVSNTDEELKEEVKYHNKLYKELQDKDTWIENKSFPIACFHFNEDNYLKWHCPISEVRKYLETQCGVKTKWYHKLFFKGTKRYH